jgi:hypothetical protein
LSDTPEGGLQDLIETAKSHVRVKVEHPFLLVKQQFAFYKTLLRGLAKNSCKINVISALRICSWQGDSYSQQYEQGNGVPSTSILAQISAI